MKSWSKRAQPLLLAAAMTALLISCDEQLELGTACPSLCPEPPASVRDTILTPVELDTSIAGFPRIGTERQLYVASFGDTLQTRAVFRYDSLPNTFRHTGTVIDSTIVFVDTGAVIRLYPVTGDTLAGDSTTVEAYDVADTANADNVDPNAVQGNFTPDRLLGSRTFAAESLKDSIDVPIDPAKLLDKLSKTVPDNKLRVGIRVATEGKHVTFLSTNNGSQTKVIFRPSADTETVPKTILIPRSLGGDATTDPALADYLTVVTSPPAPPPDVIRVGSLPGARVYLRFNIPARILDSSNIVRATLLLTQRPNGFSPRPGDSITVQPLAVIAGTTLTDITKALVFLFQPPSTDSLRVLPTDSAQHEVEIIHIIKVWQGTTADRTPRAIALRSSTEGTNGSLIDFFDFTAPSDVQPKLRISYLPRTAGGIP